MKWNPFECLNKNRFENNQSSIFIFYSLLFYFRVKLPWTKAFAALPTICFSYMVCILFFCLIIKEFFLCRVRFILGLRCFVRSWFLSLVSPSVSTATILFHYMQIMLSLQTFQLVPVHLFAIHRIHDCQGYLFLSHTLGAMLEFQ